MINGKLLLVNFKKLIVQKKKANSFDTDEASGKTYYFNESTGVTQWDDPFATKVDDNEEDVDENDANDDDDDNDNDNDNVPTDNDVKSI
jgi:hypothetical protein